MMISKRSMAAALAVLGLGMATGAGAQPASYDGYTSSSIADTVWMNPFGLCWRAGSVWTEQKAIPQCDPNLVPKPRAVAPAPAPVVVAPPPPPPAPKPIVAVAPPVQVDRDSDGDGVIDRLDQCPGTRAGAKVDAVGCEVAEVITLRGVNFATNSARLTPGSTKTLDAAAATLLKRGDVKTEVAGHTDDRGSAARNQTLSQQRAEAVVKYLISKGVNPANLTARGYGEDRPVADNKTEAGRAENRRVELRAQ